MFSRPVSSGWKPVPTSRSEPTRPRISACPFVGAVMRDRILSNVLLPAPLRPMMPTTSPFLTSKETSLRAQMVSGEWWDEGPRPRRRNADFSVSVRWSRRVSWCRTAVPRRYRLERPSTLITTSTSNDVRKGTLRVLEVDETTEQQGHHHDGRCRRDGKIGAGLAQKGPAEALDHAGHGIEAIEEAPFLGHQAERVYDG